MVIQFDKKELSCLRCLVRDIKEQEQTHELRINDEMPGVGRVLRSWGQILIRGKEWRSGTVQVNGGVTAWVLYEPEDGGEPQCIQGWLPFQMKWDFPDAERDGTVEVQPVLISIDARCASSRKLILRSVVSILAEASVQGRVSIFSPGQLPDDVRLLENKYPILIPKEAGEKAFSLEEDIQLGSGMPAITRLVSYHNRPMISEQKIMGDKLILRGINDIHIVYLDRDGTLNSWDAQVQFSQYTQLDHDYSEQSESLAMPVVTGLELELNENNTVLCKIGLSLQYRLYEREMISLVTDAYSPLRDVKPYVEGLNIPAILSRELLLTEVEQTVSFEGVRAADAVFYPEHPKIYREEQSFVVELAGTFQLLGYDSMGQLQLTTKRWEHTKEIAGDSTVKMIANMYCTNQMNVLFRGDGTLLESELSLELMANTSQGMPMVTALELGECKLVDTDRPALILRRAGTESLWLLAKQTGTTIEAIRQANGLEGDPDPDRMLLIPIV